MATLNIVSFLSDYWRGVPTTPVRLCRRALAIINGHGKSENSDTTSSAVPLHSRVPDRIAVRRIPFGAMSELLTQAQTLDQRAIAVDVGTLQVVEELATTGNHAQQAAARVVILDVLLEVTGQVIDAGRQQSHLDFGEPVSPWARWKSVTTFDFCSVVNAMSNSLSLKRRCPGLIELSV